MAEGDATTQEKKSPTRLSREEIFERARSLTGENRHVVAGALAGETNETFTETQVQKLTKDFVKRDEERPEDDEGDEE